MPFETRDVCVYILVITILQISRFILNLAATTLKLDAESLD